ncbi:MAG TPA: hypothetical protein VFW94_11355 [Candidatus Acidoferrales bacterium]|nr:hypothetical protein [Candidatus Acidoferrales bacterium]
MKKRPKELTQDTEPNEDRLERHRRKCQICDHPLREEIEEEFVNWHPVYRLAKSYDLADYRSIYRHATATGLINARRDNMRWALDSILEQAPGHVNADSVIRAIRAYSCLDENNKWSEPPTQVIFSVADRQIPASGRSRIKHAVRACPEPARSIVEVLLPDSDAEPERHIEDAEQASIEQIGIPDQDANALLESDQIEANEQAEPTAPDEPRYDDAINPTVSINYVGNVPFADSNRFAREKR